MEEHFVDLYDIFMRKVRMTVWHSTETESDSGDNHEQPLETLKATPTCEPVFVLTLAIPTGMVFKFDGFESAAKISLTEHGFWGGAGGLGLGGEGGGEGGVGGDGGLGGGGNPADVKTILGVHIIAGYVLLFLFTMPMYISPLRLLLGP